MTRTVLFSIICLFLAVASMNLEAAAQSTDEQLAEYYYEQGQYEQALLYYEKIYKTNRSNRIYEKYLGSLVAMGEFEDAEKLIKKKLKSSRSKSPVYVELGELYRQFDKPEEAKEAFDDALKELEPGRSNAIRLGNAYIKLNEYEFALDTYKKARRIGTDNYTYDYEIANLQGIMGNHDEMVESFLDLLLQSPNYIQTVQNSINRNLNIQEDEAKAELVKNKLLRRVQKYPDITIYSEMLIWLFEQKKDFSSAYVQAKALDKRMDENGFRLMDLANLALNNEDYSTARKCYQAVVDKGRNNDYYITARIELLQVTRKELISKPGYTQEQIVEVEQMYENAIDDLGRSGQTAIMLKELAHVKAFYLQKTEEAIDLLYEAIDLPGIYPAVQAVIKLELGNILMLKGEIWDASLLYSQVELDFKEDPLGHEAKFRNAKISYYTGDFEWAQAQLDVLKASTSKLISNDAIDLSLLITDNLALDTITTPMLMYAQADLLAYQNHTGEAFAKLDSIVDTWPAHSLTDEIFMLKAEVYEKKGNYEAAADQLQKIIDFHFYDILADDAIFKMATFNDYVFDRKEEAMSLYERILTEYPGSLYVIEARKRFRELRGDKLEQ